MTQTNKEKEANGLSHKFKNLVTALQIHRCYIVALLHDREVF